MKISCSKRRVCRKKLNDILFIFFFLKIMNDARLSFLNENKGKEEVFVYMTMLLQINILNFVYPSYFFHPLTHFLRKPRRKNLKPTPILIKIKASIHVINISDTAKEFIRVRISLLFSFINSFYRVLNDVALINL